MFYFYGGSGTCPIDNTSEQKYKENTQQRMGLAPKRRV